MNFTIKVITETLSDRSKVYNVVLIGDGSTFKFAACSKQDAKEFAQQLADLIDSRTVDMATFAESLT